jgi:ankyrin repeat protein
MNDDLALAIENNDKDTVSRLIASGGVVNLNAAATDTVKMPPLIHAAALGRIEIMTLLLDAGASIDVIDSHGKSVYHAAVAHNQLATLRWLLLERGGGAANLNNNAESDLLLQEVTHNRDDRIAILLLDADAPIDRLAPIDLMNLVARPRSVAVLQRLLKRDVDVRALRDSKNRSLCHRVIVGASHNNHDHDVLLQAVVAAGVGVNAVDDNNRTALHYAALWRNATSLRVLVELGADIDQRDCLGASVLHWLGGSGNDDGSCAELMLAFGANVRVADNQGRTPCCIAAQRRLRAQLCAFLAAGGELEQSYSNFTELPTTIEIEAARQRIARRRLDFVRHRALEICVGLQPLNLDALQLCEIMTQSFGVYGSLIAFHQWWRIATLFNVDEESRLFVCICFFFEDVDDSDDDDDDEFNNVDDGHAT